MTKADDEFPAAEYEALKAAQVGYVPPCRGQALFTANGLTPAARAQCAAICARCRITELCDAYAEADKASGFWGGHFRDAKGIKRPTRPKAAKQPAT